MKEKFYPALVKKTIYTVLIFCLVFSLYPMALFGQQVQKNQGSGTLEDPFVVPKTDSEITLDGILDEKAWQDALMLELLYEVRPGENVPPPVQTQVFLSYDSRNLYAAFRCYDPEPSAIRAHLSDRDSHGGDDWVGLIFDTFNDQRRSFVFIVTAQGVQLDLIETQSGDDAGWDGIWDCASEITDWGYCVEMVLPFSTVQFQRKKGYQVWGFDAVRSYPRDHTYHIGLFPRDRSNNCYLCQAVKIRGFEGVSPGRNLEINPTLTAIRTDEREDFPKGDFKKEYQDAEFGVSTRWGITSNLTLNLAANPDFSQIEADARQLDINQPFALFYPEKRPFFTEGLDFFSSLKEIIYTRTVRDPTWGVKLTGKEGPNTIGAFVMRDDITNLIFPGSQGSSSTSLWTNNLSSVFRYKRDFGSRNTAGIIFTDREGSDYFNRVYGFDLDFRLTQTEQIQLLALRSSTKYPNDVAEENSQSSGKFNDGLISFEYDHNSRTWGWWADYEEVGSNFRADLGYFPRVGYRNVEGGVNYTWNAPPNTWWALLKVGSEVNYFEDQKGNLLNKRASVWFSYTGALQSNFFIRGAKAVQAYKGYEFDLTTFTAGGNLWPASFIQVGGSVFVGNQIDYANIRLGNIWRLDFGVLSNLGKHLRLTLQHTYERMMVQDARLYTANISQLNAVYQFTTRMFFRSIIQYVNYDFNPGNYTFDTDSEQKNFFSQLLFSYKFNPRTVLFLGYSDNYFGDQGIRLTQSDRTFFLKIGYAWML
jgi:hypothetical protein